MQLEKLKNFFKKLNFKTIVLIYILAYTVVPIVSVSTSKYLTTYFYMAVVVVAVFFSFNVCRLGDIRDYAFLLLPFILYELLTIVVAGNSNVLLAGYQVLLFLLPVCLGYTLIKGEYSYNLLAAVLALIFAGTAVTTILGCLTDPDAARILATTKTSQDPTAIGYMMRNIGGYTFVYMAVLMYPCVILAFKMKKLNVIFLILFAVLAFTLAINAQYTFALLLLMVSSLMIFVPRDISLKKFILLIVLFVVGLFVFRGVVAAVLTRIGEMIDNPAMTEKMTAVFLGQEAVDNMDDPRGALYMMSVNAFLKHPFFGSLLTGGMVSGGHSFVLDNLAQFGIIGAALMLTMYQGVYKVFYQPLREKPGYCIVFWTFLQPIILSSINTGMWLNVLCMMTPIILSAVYGSEVYKGVLEKKRSHIPIRPLICKETL